MNKLLFSFIIILTISCKQQTSNNHHINTPSDFSEIGFLLDSIHIEDQKYRKQIDSINSEFGWESKKMKNLWKTIQKVDSSNLLIVETILEKHGWLGSDKIGGTANSTLFLVIQHSNQKTQEKYLPLMKEAVKAGNANARSLAMLEDRILLGKGELQIYGSQISINNASGENYVLPLFEPEHVNTRRAEVGFSPIEDYVAHWGMTWDVEEYKQNLPRYIEIMKGKKK